jgi:hypothetical protein
MPRMVPFSNFLGRCYCMKIQPMVDSCPNFQDILSRKLWAYLLKFGWLSLFGHPSVGDRLNCESSESRGTRAVAPKSEWWTVTLDQKWLSSELCASITHAQCRSQHTSQLSTLCWWVWSERIWWVGQRSPKLSQACRHKQALVWVSFDIHNSAKQMKDKRLKSLAKPQGQGLMITKTQGAHLVRVRDTLVVLSHNERARDEHGNACVYWDLTTW